MKKSVTIVTPVFNDWNCLNSLVNDIGKVIGDTINTIHIVAINDCSVDAPPDTYSTPSNVKLEILNLVTNVGHQRAILIGLCHCFETEVDSDYFVVMDSDGEDNPKYITELVRKCESIKIDSVVFAKRSKRSEKWSFKLFYRIYKMIFRVLTGASISFGNFSCIPKSILYRVCNEPNFWNHYSSSMIKSNIPFSSIPTERSKRYSGNSKMNLNNLILHGLSSLSVYMEAVIIRVLKFSVLIFLFLVVCLCVVVYVKYFTSLAIPGWATYIFGFLFNILITVVLFNLLIILSHLNTRNKPISRPLSFYSTLIKK